MTLDLPAIGFILIVIGIALIIAGSLTQDSKNTKVAVGGFIGFIPFGFGNDPELVKIVIILSAVLALVFLLFALRVF